MLVLSRKPGEKIIIGNNITVTVVEIIGNRVKIALDAPPKVRILRSELAEWQDRSPPASVSRDTDVQPHVVVGR